MTVLVLGSVPSGLRGITSRWLLEIAPGVFVGTVSKRVRELLWKRVLGHIGSGNALLVWRDASEQHIAFERHNFPWETIDFDGLTLIARPTPPQVARELRRRLETE